MQGMAFSHKYYFLYPDIIIKAVYIIFKMADLVILEKYILQTGLELKKQYCVEVMIVVYLHQKVERKIRLLREKILAQDTTTVDRKLRWLNTVLRAVSSRACFKLDKQTWRRKRQWCTEDDFTKSTH